MADYGAPLKGDEVVIQVPRGAAGNVRIEEVDARGPAITVRVSKDRIGGDHLVGVVVK